eukprot:1681870-Prymnesium_polylepis.2
MVSHDPLAHRQALILHLLEISRRGEVVRLGPQGVCYHRADEHHAVEDERQQEKAQDARDVKGHVLLRPGILPVEL